MSKAATKAEREHMARVAALGCMICHRPAEIHHVRTGQGMGQRASGFDTIPLCHRHHRTGGYAVAFHAGSKCWQKKYGRELELLEKVMAMLNEIKLDRGKL